MTIEPNEAEGGCFFIFCAFPATERHGPVEQSRLLRSALPRHVVTFLGRRTSGYGVWYIPTVCRAYDADSTEKYKPAFSLQFPLLMLGWMLHAFLKHLQSDRQDKKHISTPSRFPFI